MGKADEVLSKIEEAKITVDDARDYHEILASEGMNHQRIWEITDAMRKLHLALIQLDSDDLKIWKATSFDKRFEDFLKVAKLKELK